MHENNPNELVGTARDVRTCKSKVKVFPGDSKPYGVTFPEWTAKWWQWLVSVPKQQNPAIDQTGENCGENQKDSNVWFLAGTQKPLHSAVQKCTVPSGKAILFPIITSLFSYAEVPKLRSDSDLIAYAAKDIDRMSQLKLMIDGQELQDLEKYRIRFGPFPLSYPPNNVSGIPPGYTTAPLDGFWVFLEPLPYGDHKIYFRGVEPNFHTEVSYFLTVKLEKW